MSKCNTNKMIIKIYCTNHIKDLATQMKIKLETVKKVLRDAHINKEILSLEETEYLLEILEYKFEIHKTVKDRLTNAHHTLHEKPPVVGIMGHVDHGKTSILDAIRKSNVAINEHGGITQHISSYAIIWKNKSITFIDTPGHEAFVGIRKRGVLVMDIVLLVISAAEGINKQTIESINHIKESKVHFIVVINKCDLPNANPLMVEQKLLEHNILVESMGGDILSVHCSAKTGDNINQLLDYILLQAEVLNLTAPIDCSARGIVLETFLDKHKGVIVHALIQYGTLKQRDCCVIGNQINKVRLIKDDTGQNLVSAGPSTPVEVWGFSKAPKPGDDIIVVKSEVEGRALIREEYIATSTSTIAQATSNNIQALQTLNIILKCDAYGSSEALKRSLTSHSHSVILAVIHDGVGPINASDLNLAQLTNAIILNFNMETQSIIKRQADDMQIRIFDSSIIYKLVDMIKDEIDRLIVPEIYEKILGEAEILQIFNFPKVGTVIGCVVRNGFLNKGQKYKILDDKGEEIFKSKIGSLQKERENVETAREGIECGIALGKVKLQSNPKKIIAYEEETK